LFTVGQPSFFRITSPSWEPVGLDTSWDTDVLTKGASTVVASVAGASDRKMVLPSHHQLVSVDDKEGMSHNGNGRRRQPHQLSTRCGAVWVFRAAEQRLAGRCREPDRAASVEAWRAGEHPHSETVEETRDGLDGGADVGDDEA
jgi:hypothetical protein